MKLTNEEKWRLIDFICGSVNELELNVRTANILNQERIVFVWQTLVLSDDEYLTFKGMGKGSLQHLREHTVGPWPNGNQLSYCDQVFRKCFREAFSRCLKKEYATGLCGVGGKYISLKSVDKAKGDNINLTQYVANTLYWEKLASTIFQLIN